MNLRNNLGFPRGGALVLPLIALFCLPAAADKYAAEFLKIGAGARALGMGSAVTALVDDGSAVYWNPAGMTAVERGEIVLMHAEQFGDLADYNFGSFVQSLEGTGTPGAVGIGIVHFSVDDILITEGAFDDENGNHRYDPGERIKEDEFYLDSDTEYGIFLSYARDAGDALSLGGSLKLVRQDLAGEGSFGIGADVGALWRSHPKFQLGARLSDVTTTQLFWDSGHRESVSPALSLGAAFFPLAHGRLFSGVIACDLATTFDGRETASTWAAGSLGIDPHVGAELWFRQIFAARIGHQPEGVTGGAGLRIRGFGVDYAFVPHEDLDSSHRVSASYCF